MDKNKFPEPASKDNYSAFANIPIEITVTVGRARPEIKDLLSLDHQTVLILDREVDDPVELFVGDRCIARGQLEEVTKGQNLGRLAVRLTEIFETKLSAQS